VILDNLDLDIVEKGKQRVKAFTQQSFVAHFHQVVVEHLALGEIKSD